MRVMVFVKATGDSEKGAPPTPEAMEAMGRFNLELHNAGLHFHFLVTEVTGEDQFLVDIELDLAEVDVLLVEFGAEIPGEGDITFVQFP